MNYLEIFSKPCCISEWQLNSFPVLRNFWLISREFFIFEGIILIFFSLFIELFVLFVGLLEYSYCLEHLLLAAHTASVYEEKIFTSITIA